MNGRGTIHKKDMVDETRSLDILELQKAGVFRFSPGYPWASKWKHGNEVVASIGYTLEIDPAGASALRFEYSMPIPNSDKRRHLNYPVSLDSTPCNYGGVRWWFICPLVLDGRKCERRCRILYLPPGAIYFGCRECYQLTYECRQKHRDKFYEGVRRPMKILDDYEKKLMRARTPKEIEKVIRKGIQARDLIETFISRRASIIRGF
jgi:hypothetical protein